jgi:NAD+ kinase
MPKNLVFVRHGESEGNAAKRLAQKGDLSAFTPEFLARHSSKFRLTSRGRSQAESAGNWLRNEFPEGFDRHYVSEYVRAMETAGLLDLPKASWFSDFYLREQDYGEMDVLPPEVRETKYANALLQRDRDGFYWKPPGGESIADLCLRFDRLLETLGRECSDKNVIVVCHGMVMWAARIRLERLTSVKYAALQNSNDKRDRIHNCQVLHYTRIDPASNELTSHLGWMRSVCPTDLERSHNSWEKIDRPRYTNEDLLTEVNKYERLVEHI